MGRLLKAFSHAATFWMWPRCVIKVSVLSLQKALIKGFLSDAVHSACLCQHARASPFPQQIPDFCWLTLQEDKSQTTGWRWTQPAQSSLRMSVFLTVRLTPHCLPWFSPPLPLTTESCLSSNAKRMRIGLSSYLKEHSWTRTKMIRRTGSTVSCRPSDRNSTLSPLCSGKEKS